MKLKLLIDIEKRIDEIGFELQTKDNKKKMELLKEYRDLLLEKQKLQRLSFKERRALVYVNTLVPKIEVTKKWLSQK